MQSILKPHSRAVRPPHEAFRSASILPSCTLVLHDGRMRQAPSPRSLLLREYIICSKRSAKAHKIPPPCSAGLPIQMMLNLWFVCDLLGSTKNPDYGLILWYIFLTHEAYGVKSPSISATSILYRWVRSKFQTIITYQLTDVIYLHRYKSLHYTALNGRSEHEKAE